MNPKNVFYLYEQVYKYEEPKLNEAIDHVVQFYGSVALDDGLIETMNRSSMNFLLSQSKSMLSEHQLLSVLLRWADSQARRLGHANPGPQVVRELCGELLYQVRIPLMKMNDLLDLSEKTEILSPRESLNIVYYLNSKDKPPNEIVRSFNLSPRKTLQNVSITTYVFRSFGQSFFAENLMQYSLPFRSSFEFCLQGLTVCNEKKLDMTVSLVDYDDEDQSYAEVTILKKNMHGKSFHVNFDICTLIKVNKFYKIVLHFANTRLPMYKVSETHRDYNSSYEKFGQILYKLPEYIPNAIQVTELNMIV